MKKCFYLSWLLPILLATPLRAFGPFTLQFSTSNFTFSQAYGRDSVLYDCIQGTGYDQDVIPGAPELPVKVFHYIIPPNMVPDSVVIDSKTLDSLSNSYYLYPTQPSFHGDSIPPWVPPDSTIYGSDSLYPLKPIVVTMSGGMDGSRIVTIKVYPFQYRPLSRRLYILTDITFELILRGATPLEVPTVRSVFYNDFWTAAIEGLLSNPEDIPAYAPQPPITPDEQLLSGNFALYVIITSTDLQTAFQPLVTWLTDRGTPATTVTTSWIYSNYPGVDQAEQIRNYLKVAHNSHGTTWVLLGGGKEIVPIRYA